MRLIIPLLCAAILIPAVALAQTPVQEKSSVTLGNSRFVHRIPLSDGTTQIRPPADDKAPQPKPMNVAASCVTCHPMNLISKGWHFNATDPSVAPGRNGEPWILVDAQTRTVLPLSYRNWKGAIHPEKVGITPFEFTHTFGRHMPGGGPGVMTEVADSHAPWAVSGKLEVDCMMCHVADNSHDQFTRFEFIEQHNLKYAPTAALGLAKIDGSVKKQVADAEDEEDLKKAAAKGLKMTWDKSRFDAEQKVLLDLVREPPMDRCYYCHTTHVVSQGATPRWMHDTDVHLTSGMKCTDCHRSFIDHQDTRGYEGEAKERNKPEIASLTCAGCHLGEHAASDADKLGGKLGSPKPEHKGIPPVHFELLSCTACHSGPWPKLSPEMVQTSLAHSLGLQKGTRTDQSLPQIAEPVFLKGHDGKIAPHRMVWPNYWAWMQGEQITPLPPATVAKAVGDKLLPKISEKDSHTPLADVTINEVLGKLNDGGFDLPGAHAAAPSTQPSTKPAAHKAKKGEGIAVYISGGKLFKRDPSGRLLGDEHKAAEPYAWPMAHDVRPGPMALGVRGCADCHSAEGAVFFAKVASLGPIDPKNQVVKTNYELRGESGLLHQAWVLGFQGRTLMKVIVFGCAAVIFAVLLHFGLKTLGLVLPRRG